jgi:hypothetical protein
MGSLHVHPIQRHEWVPRHCLHCLLRCVLVAYSPRSPAATPRYFQRAHDFSRGIAQTQEMTISERLDCGSTPRKQDVDGTVDAVAADKRYGDCGQTIIDGRSFVGASSK